MGLESNTFIEQVDNTFLFILIISVSLLVLVTFFMVFFVIRYNRKRNTQPTDIEGNLFLEITWTVVPVILVLFMFYFGWTGFQFTRNVPDGAMLVKVTGRMWSWLFEYENGTKSDMLKVPAGKPVKLALTSQDVIHSLYIPAFRIKEDALPHMETYLWFLPDEPGTYDIFCAEYCGQGHSSMISKLLVLSEHDFSNWYEGLETPTRDSQTKEQLKVSGGATLIREKGCTACHSIDGSTIVGPTFKGISGRKTIVITEGKEHEITSDDIYIQRSILDPLSDIVKGYPPIMPSQRGLLNKEEVEAIVQYLKSLK